MFRVCNNVISRIVVLVFLILLPQISHAQGKWDSEDADQFRERAQRMKLNKIVEVLRLSDEKEMTFRSTYTTYQKGIDESLQTLQRSAERLQDVLRNKESDAAITAATDETRQAVVNLSKAQEARSQAVRSMLTPKQYAKYVLFELRFQEILRRIRDRQQDRQQRER